VKILIWILFLSFLLLCDILHAWYYDNNGDMAAILHYPCKVRRRQCHMNAILSPMRERSSEPRSILVHKKHFLTSLCMRFYFKLWSNLKIQKYFSLIYLLVEELLRSIALLPRKHHMFCHCSFTVFTFFCSCVCQTSQWSWRHKIVSFAFAGCPKRIKDITIFLKVRYNPRVTIVGKDMLDGPPCSWSLNGLVNMCSFVATSLSLRVLESLMKSLM
jgi:hypothetical protein